jgi:hypothetical protein
LANAINELPTDLKNAFVLRTLENCPEAEAAELLGLSPKGVGARVYRTRRLLLRKMSEMGFWPAILRLAFRVRYCWALNVEGGPDTPDQPPGADSPPLNDGLVYIPARVRGC